MKYGKKRLLSLLLSAALVLSMLCTGAMAAAAPQPIGVDVNGKEISFTTIVPGQKEGRTYVPVRPVFDALGAAVYYVAAEEKIVVEKNGVAVSMVMGANELIRAENGVTVTLPAKGAAYLDSGYVCVPVRDVAQALGCLVGWDNSARTVIIIDPNALAEAAMANYQYRLIEGYNAYATRFNAGTWETELTMAMSATMMAAEIMKLDAAATGVTSNASEGELSMTMKLDMSGMADLVELLNGFTGGEAAVSGLSAGEAVMDVTMEARVDLDGGKIYLLMEGLPEEAGLPADTWLCMDMDELMAASGQSIDLAQLVELSSSDLDVAGLITAQAQLVDINSRTTAMENVRTVVNAAAKLLSDSSFIKDGSVYTMSLSEEKAELTIRLTVDGEGDVVAYEVDMDMSAALGELADTLENSVEGSEEYGQLLDGASFTIQAAMDEDNAMTAIIEFSVGELFGVKMDMEGRYTASDRVPATQPPEGAAVVDYMEWLAQLEG